MKDWHIEMYNEIIAPAIKEIDYKIADLSLEILQNEMEYKKEIADVLNGIHKREIEKLVYLKATIMKGYYIK